MRDFGDRWSRSDVRIVEQKEEIASKYPGVMPSWPGRVCSQTPDLCVQNVPLSHLQLQTQATLSCTEGGTLGNVNILVSTSICSKNTIFTN